MKSSRSETEDSLLSRNFQLARLCQYLVDPVHFNIKPPGFVNIDQVIVTTTDDRYGELIVFHAEFTVKRIFA